MLIQLRHHLADPEGLGIAADNIDSDLSSSSLEPEMRFYLWCKKLLEL